MKGVGRFWYIYGIFINQKMRERAYATLENTQLYVYCLSDNLENRFEEVMVVMRKHIDTILN